MEERASVPNLGEAKIVIKKNVNQYQKNTINYDKNGQTLRQN